MRLLFTYPWIIRRHFGNKKTVIDLGAGDGSFMKIVNDDKKYKVIGVELFEPYIKKAKKTRVYQDVIKGDVTKLGKIKEEFDVVHSSQVIEHLTKDEAKKFLQSCDLLSRQTIIIGTPNGHFHQEEYDENEHQEHKSAWSIKDFKKLKFKVYGQGLKAIYGENGILETGFGKIPFVRYILYIVSYICSPFVYIFPEYAAHLIAVKEK